MIYVVRTKNSSPTFIKVGYAKKSLANRIKALQTSCPYNLELVFAKNGEKEEERRMHKALESFRVSREWFQWNEAVAKILKLPLNGTPLNPENPGMFLTPRQKQINHLFRRGSGYSIHISTMELFLARHQYTLKELLQFPEKKRRFVIIETTRREIYKTSLGIESLQGDDDLDKVQLFVCAKISE